jgi:hypothetical protein
MGKAGSRMIWVILVFLGVPLWLCVLGILMVVHNNRQLRRRQGDIVVSVRRAGGKRWIRGHAVWVSDVFAWRGSPAAWNEDLLHVTHLEVMKAGAEEQKKLHRLGAGLAIVMLATDLGETVEVAAGDRSALLGPFASSKSA